MTLQVFPSLAGQAWPLTRAPIWKTGIQTTQSGREMRTAFMSYPLYKWSTEFDLLRSSISFLEFQQLIGFFNLMSGAALPFVYYDADDTNATGQFFGTGDGVTKQFQLVKNLAAIYVEPVGYANVGSSFFINGVLQISGYAVNSPYNGWINFGIAPSAGTSLTWSGTYAYVCRFLSDTTEFTKFQGGLYEAKKLEFMSLKP